MIDYAGLNCFVWACLVLCGCAVGWLLCNIHYRKLLRTASEDYNGTIRDLRERNERLEQDSLCAKHDIKMLEEEVKDWKAEAAEWEAKARAFYELLHECDQKE